MSQSASINQPAGQSQQQIIFHPSPPPPREFPSPSSRAVPTEVVSPSPTRSSGITTRTVPAISLERAMSHFAAAVGGASPATPSKALESSPEYSTIRVLEPLESQQPNSPQRAGRRRSKSVSKGAVATSPRARSEFSTSVLIRTLSNISRRSISHRRSSTILERSGATRDSEGTSDASAGFDAPVAGALGITASSPLLIPCQTTASGIFAAYTVTLDTSAGAETQNSSASSSVRQPQFRSGVGLTAAVGPSPLGENTAPGGELATTTTDSSNGGMWSQASANVEDISTVAFPEAKKFFVKRVPLDVQQVNACMVDSAPAAVSTSSQQSEDRRILIEDLHKLSQLGSRYVESIVAVHENNAESCLLVASQHLSEAISLSTWRPSEEGDVADLIRDVCRAIRYCKAHNIHHLHLQKSNIFFSQAAQISERTFIVTGFGYAQLFRQCSASQLWDLGYRDVSMFPPELVRLEAPFRPPSSSAPPLSTANIRAGINDEAMDLWALGCIAYEMLYGNPMYESGDDDEVSLTKDELFDIIASDDCVPLPWSLGIRKPLQRRPSHLHPPDATLVSVLHCLLSKDPEQRRTCNDWLKVLNKLNLSINPASFAPGLLSQVTSGGPDDYALSPMFPTTPFRGDIGNASTNSSFAVWVLPTMHNVVTAVPVSMPVSVSASSLDNRSGAPLKTASSVLGASVVSMASSDPTGLLPYPIKHVSSLPKDPSLGFLSTYGGSSTSVLLPFEPLCSKCRQEDTTFHVCAECHSPTFMLCTVCFDEHQQALRVATEMAPLASAPTEPNAPNEETSSTENIVARHLSHQFVAYVVEEVKVSAASSRRSPSRSSRAPASPLRTTAHTLNTSDTLSSATADVISPPPASIQRYVSTLSSSTLVTPRQSPYVVQRRLIPLLALSAREQSIYETSGSLPTHLDMDRKDALNRSVVDARKRSCAQMLASARRSVSQNPNLNVSNMSLVMAESLGSATPQQLASASLTRDASESTLAFNILPHAHRALRPESRMATSSFTQAPESVALESDGTVPAFDVTQKHRDSTAVPDDTSFPKDLEDLISGAAVDTAITADDLIGACATDQGSCLQLNDLQLEALPPALLIPLSLLHVTVLDLANNLLTVIPDGIEYLVNLRRLLLGNNRLTELPDAIGNLTDLEFLDVNHNQLSTLPQTLMFCDQMDVLALDYNNFDEIPTVVFDLPRLRTIYLIQNPIAAWPDIELLQNLANTLTIGLDNSPILCETLPTVDKIEVVWNKVFPDCIIPGVFVGSLRSAQSVEVYEKLNIRYLLTMGRGLDAVPPPGGKHKVVIVDDLPGASIDFSFQDAVEFIDEAVRSGVGCLVHCFAGMSRSATAVIAYLMMKRGMRLDEAYCTTRRGRPAIYPNAGFFDQLAALDAKLFAGQRPLDMASMEREKVP